MSYWLSCRKLTVAVVTDGAGLIIDAAPVVRRFRRQHIDNLRRWMRSLGGYREERL